MECHSIRDTRLFRISFCRNQSGIRHANNQISVYRIRLCQCLSRNNSCMIDINIINHTVHSCEIYIFKNTSCLLLRIDRHGFIRFHSMFCEAYNFSRLYISYEFSANGSNRTAFGSKEICIISLSDTERFQSERISCSDQFSRRGNNQRICTFDLLHRIFHRVFCLLYIQTFSGNMICNHFRINRCLENCACVLQFMAKLDCIGQVTIMCDRKNPFHIINNQRHRIFCSGTARRRISDMSDTKISLQFLKRLFIEYFIYQSKAFLGMYFPLSICIRHRNTTAFLSSVLQCKKSIINRWCNISAIHIIGSKHTAFFTQSCCYFFKFTHKCRLHSFQIFHLSKLSLKSILLY